MKFTAEAAAFAEAATWTARFLPSLPPVPVLAAIRLHADGDADTVTLAAFDYEVATHTTLDTAANVAVAAPGTVLVAGRLLAEVARQVAKGSGKSGGTIEVIAEDSKVLLRAGRAEFTLLTLPLEDYPTLPEMPEAIGQIDAAFFARAITQTAIAASRDLTVPALSGVRIDLHADRSLRMMATDRYRMAVRALPCWQPVLTPHPVYDNPPDTDQESGPGTGDVSLLVARSTLADIAKAFTDTTPLTVGLAVNAQGCPERLGIQLAGRTVVTRLLDNGGGVVSVDRLLNHQRPLIAAVATAAFAAAVRRVAVVADRNVPVRLTFTPNTPSTDGADEARDGELELRVGNGEEAASRDVLPVRLTGATGTDPVTVAFNPTYLVEALTALNPGVCHLAMTTASATDKPALLTDSATDELDYWHILMPIRITS